MPGTLSERTCVTCNLFQIYMASPSYSEYTPGEKFDMACEKDHWKFKRFDSEDHFRECLQTAAACPDYQRRNV